MLASVGKLGRFCQFQRDVLHTEKKEKGGEVTCIVLVKHDDEAKFSMPA